MEGRKEGIKGGSKDGKILKLYTGKNSKILDSWDESVVENEDFRESFSLWVEKFKR